MNTLQYGSEAHFASDLHLSESTPNTLNAFERWLATVAQEGALIYLLGDLFEYWVGDDHLTETALRFAQACASAKDAGAEVFLMHGNRDFLLGEHFAEICNATLLSDPEFLNVGGQVVLLTHGDQLCTDDHAYQQFRHQSRQPAWQEAFLAKPRAERIAYAEHLRQQSQMHQRKAAPSITDVNSPACHAALQGHWPDGTFVGKSHLLLHGHTHRCALHGRDGVIQQAANATETDLQRIERIVLPDWDFDAVSPRLWKGGSVKLTLKADQSPELGLVVWR